MEPRVTQMPTFLLIATLVGCIGSGAPPPATADVRPVLLVQVARWQGPDNTVITLGPDGTLQRFDGSLLVVRREGSAVIAQDEARALIERAEGLPDPMAVPDAPLEGDRFLVVTPAGRVISAPETTAARELVLLINDVLRVAERVALTANRAHYVRIEHVDSSRAGRLRDAGTRAPAIDSLDAALRGVVENGVGAPMRFLAVDQRTYAGLLAALGGRDAFVQAGDGTWFQVELWSPAE